MQPYSSLSEKVGVRPRIMAHPEQRLSERELSPLVEILARKFVQRWDMYPRQYDNDRPYFTVTEPLHIGLLQQHLQGELTLGTYLLNAESQARFLILDADDMQQWEQLNQVAQQVAAEGLPSYLERSRQGGHLWFFFDKWLPGGDLRLFAKGLLLAHGISKMEVYPKQDMLSDGPGSLIRMPFGVHQVTGKRYGFYNVSGKPLAPTLREQLQLLGAAETVSEAEFLHYQSYAPEPKERPEFTPVEVAGERVSDRIKAAISVGDFVGRFVELSSNGRGYCPFHDDTHTSFGVNDKRNYWSCFAGCGGGSIIDFWMLYQQCDFKTAVSELAEMLLK